MQSDIIGIDKEIIKKTIDIRKQYHIKLPDALIAATSITHNLTLIADNDRDFEKITQLTYINPNKTDFNT